MDLQSFIALLQESLYLILVFCGFLFYAMLRGRQSLINLILALYLALLISIEFPYYDAVLSSVEGTQVSNSLIMILIFAGFTIGAAFLFGKLMPQNFEESAMEGFGKKVVFALLASILVMAYSYNVLPITEIITPGSPIETLFGSSDNFFWWLLIPLIGLLLI